MLFCLAWYAAYLFKDTYSSHLARRCAKVCGLLFVLPSRPRGPYRHDCPGLNQYRAAAGNLALTDDALHSDVTFRMCDLIDRSA